jgi:hypothetical protein
MPLAECGGACESTVVLLLVKAFAARADEPLRELGRNPRRDMSVLSSQTSLRGASTVDLGPGRSEFDGPFRVLPGVLVAQ